MNLTSFGQFLVLFFKFKWKVAAESMFLFPSVRPCICMLLSAPTFLVFVFKLKLWIIWILNMSGNFRFSAILVRYKPALREVLNHLYHIPFRRF